jgi:hypothetical protein
MAIRSTSRAPRKAARTERQRKRPPPKNLPPSLARTGLADWERMLEQMFRVLLEFAHNSGISAERASGVFAHARRSVGRSPYRLRDALDLEVMLCIAEALKAWYTEPQYLDSRGKPAPLPLSGARSVEGLIARYLPMIKARHTARWLVDTEGVLRRLPTRLLVPLSRTVSFTRHNAMTLDRIPFLLQALLSTVSYNAKAKPQGRETRCEQMLALDRFRVSELPRFHREVKKLAPLLLNQLESWAAPYLEPEHSTSRRKTARVGVEVFSYTEARAARATQRGKSS